MAINRSLTKTRLIKSCRLNTLVLPSTLCQRRDASLTLIYWWCWALRVGWQVVVLVGVVVLSVMCLWAGKYYGRVFEFEYKKEGHRFALAPFISISCTSVWWSKSRNPMSKSWKVPPEFLQSSQNSVTPFFSIVRCAVVSLLDSNLDFKVTLSKITTSCKLSYCHSPHLWIGGAYSQHLLSIPIPLTPFLI